MFLPRRLLLLFFLTMAMFLAAATAGDSTKTPSIAQAGAAAAPSIAIPTAVAAGATNPAAPGAPKKVVIIPIEDEVDFGLYAFLKRAVDDAIKRNPDAIVFKVNTYGGELQSAFDIVDLLMGVSRCSTYAYVEQKAISAGALIALSCNRIVMGPGTTLGDCAPITQGKDGIVMLGEKIQSPLRAKFRTLAEKNGYPTLLAESMVSADLGVVEAAMNSVAPQYFTAKQWAALTDKERAAFASHRTLVPEGQLLTMTDREAKAYGFSQGTFASLDDFLANKHWEKAAEVRTTWSENFVRMIGKFAPILMLIGFGALYLEFKTPGMSVFGVIGIVCLAIVFGAKYAVGLANHTELLIILAGFLLFLVEIFLFPGTFIAGSIAIILIIVALTLSLQTFVIPDPKMPWELKSTIDHLFTVVGMAALAVAIPLFAIRFVLPHLPGHARVIPSVTLADARSVAPETSRLPLGAMGTTKTPLRPTGKAVFGEETVEVSSRGEFIDGGKRVEICQILGNKIIVRGKDAQA